ncbi:MAG TPA: MBL fold metallo-hydrolase [Bacteroidia bacterium]|nr:MBL fold metallo-hydrolase [Bacteroidia bacterium]
MKLIVVGTGSSGNCYILEGRTSSLIIECGVRFFEIKRALNFNYDRVAGMLISHEHKDHCRSAKEVAAAGINIFASEGTITALGFSSHRLFSMKENESQTIGEFVVMPFKIQHDAAEPFGFLIHHLECGNVLFLTDSAYSPYRFADLNQIIIEANYSLEIVEDRNVNGSMNGALVQRVMTSHMSIDTCVRLLKANDLSKVNNIVLIHLSDGNSHEREFVQRISEKTGKTVTAATNGMTIDFTSPEF